MVRDFGRDSQWLLLVPDRHAVAANLGRIARQHANISDLFYAHMESVKVGCCLHPL